MAKQSAVDKAILDLMERKRPLQAEMASLDYAIDALKRQRPAKVATVTRTRKPKEPAAQAAEVKA